jgi:WD40 repeat-containing protein SMU1
MAMEDGVLCAWFSDDGELLGTGSKDGKVKIWKVSSGQCLRKIERAHGGPVGAISLSKDCGRVLTGGFDGSVALHGVRSGARLKEMKGHTAFVNGVSFLGQDNSRAVSVSSDGTVRVWGCESGECIASTKPNPDAAGEVHERY